MAILIILALAAVAYETPHGILEQSASAVRSQFDMALAESLETKLKQVAAAANSVTPIKINSTTELFKVSSNQNTLIYYIRDLNFVLPEEMQKSKVDSFVKKLTPTVQKLVAQEACTKKGNLFLLNEGIIIRYDVHDKQKIKYMDISVSKSDCP